EAALPGARAVRQDAPGGAWPVEVLRLAGGVHRRRHGGGPRGQDRGARPERGGQDDPAAAGDRAGEAGHRGGHPRARAAPGLLRPGTRDAGPGPDRAGEHGVGRPRAEPPRAPRAAERDQGRFLGSFRFPADVGANPAAVLSGGGRTLLALALLVVSGANVLLLDEPTNNLDPLSRNEILAALRRYRGAIVLVT